MKCSVLAILGMKSNDCRERVAEALAGLSGVVDVQVSLLRARAVVTHRMECLPAALVAAVIGAGFGAEHVPDNQ